MLRTLSVIERSQQASSDALESFCITVVHFMSMCQNLCNTVLTWRSEGNLGESVLSAPVWVQGIELGLSGLAASNFK